MQGDQALKVALLLNLSPQCLNLAPAIGSLRVMRTQKQVTDAMKFRDSQFLAMR